MQKYSNYTEKREWMVIGLMSGTSVDGLDICAVQFYLEDNEWAYSIKKAESVEYPLYLKQKLIDCISFSGEELVYLDREFGMFISKSVNEFLKNETFVPELISSHGHTVFHQPEKKITYQIGDGQTILQETGIITINDFRRMDVAKGGQGAPLVPVGDQLLFANYDVCLNIGGFANISYATESGIRMAYDIGPVNIVLNKLVRKTGLDYDMNGKMASEGKILDDLLLYLNKLPYFKQPAPKSLGLEWVKKHIFPRLEINSNNLADILNTYVEHAAYQVNAAIMKELNHRKDIKILVTGGGAKNGYLMQRLNDLSSGMKYVIPEEELVDFKEALVFGLLGLLKYLGKTNVFCSVTGASSDSKSGILHN